LALANQVADASLIVVARGGGSVEDLWTFNEESVVRAIAGSRLPVITAVGHEIDVTLADLAADRRALTPSEAGEFCVPDSREVALHLDHLAGRLRMAGLAQLHNARARLDRLSDRGRSAIAQDLIRRRHKLTRFAASLEALSPLGVLARGYSLTFRADNQSLINNVNQAKPDDIIHTRLVSGLIVSRVLSTTSNP
jgi:exodeoxyribonuclease VII large subunit